MQLFDIDIKYGEVRDPHHMRDRPRATYCTFHKRTGHAMEQYRARLQPPKTELNATITTSSFTNRLNASGATAMHLCRRRRPPKEPPACPLAPPRVCIIGMATSRISAHSCDTTSLAPPDAWIFNTACRSHMSHNHELFHTSGQFLRLLGFMELETENF
jgi:hypothetical protein